MPFFPFSSAGHGVPVQASRQAKRWWFQTKKEPLPSSRKIPCKARLLCRLCGSLIAVGPGSYEILRRTIFFADCPSFLALICLSLLSLSLSLSDVCVCVCVCVCFTPKSLSSFQYPNFSDCGSLNFCSPWNLCRLSICCFLGLIDCETVFML